MEVRPHIGPGPGSQEGTCESLKGPIALAIDVLSIFHWGVGVGGGMRYFQLFLVYLENKYVKFTESSVPKAFLFRLAKFLLEGLLVATKVANSIRAHCETSLSC